jgi:hypothetical protein
VEDIAIQSATLCIRNILATLMLSVTVSQSSPILYFDHGLPHFAGSLLKSYCHHVLLAGFA